MGSIFVPVSACKWSYASDNVILISEIIRYADCNGFPETIRTGWFVEKFGWVVKFYVNHASTRCQAGLTVGQMLLLVITYFCFFKFAMEDLMAN